jgi:hypothetical protein
MPCVNTILSEARAICEMRNEGGDLMLENIDKLCSKHFADLPKKKDNVSWYFYHSARLGLFHTTLDIELFLNQLQEIVQA